MIVSKNPMISKRRSGRIAAGRTGRTGLLVGGAAFMLLSSCDGSSGSATSAAAGNASISQARITDAASLLSALKRAREGDTLLVDPGRYDMLSLQNLHFSKAVTLASRDPRDPATFTGFKMRNVSGLTIRNVECEVVASNGMFSYSILDSENIILQELNVHGSLNGNPGDDKSPIMIRGSRSITVRDSDFRELFHGISFLDSENLILSGNSFRMLRTDGIRGGGSSHLIIRGNVFTDFKPNLKDHPDGVQLWTTNTKAAARDILIEQNIMMRGDGAAIQGIFIRDTFNQFPFENLVIRSNLILGGMYNGIGIGGSKDAIVEKNVVAAFPGQKSWIRVGIAQNMVLSGNRATAYVLSDAAQVVQKSNGKVSAVRDGGKALLARWLEEDRNGAAVERALSVVLAN
ncbi:right-handed parallel beta-helix repeat-containing protein [Sphingobium limneticum]|uniref:right-handed parallel beta-helix repeat-containing protein n=1 Tax=Sphingobium limneticum TaxID=1007511 RepID=UPI00123E37C3|nr:right-handed parallel beta-helix repeat-containing protein [Sphingobium limneticum]KAA9013042.1 right-handed parallel beta-helix repeat-containing protein [Sphingobium limneticum]